MGLYKRSSCALLIAAVSAFAQVSERIEVTITNIDVVVTGANGQPVRGLTRDDFEIFEDGKQQPITNFDAIEADSSALGVAPRSSAAVAEQRFRRKVFVLVDVAATTKHGRALALANLERMMDETFRDGDYDWSVGILTARESTVTLPFTSDKVAIHDAFDEIVHAGDRHGIAMMERDQAPHMLRAGFVVRAVRDAVRGYAATPGKKILLLLTSDTGLGDFDEQYSTPGQQSFVFEPYERRRELRDLRESIINEANASDVSLYFFNVDGLYPGGDMGVVKRGQTDVMVAAGVARDTGGRVFNGNDPVALLHDFNAATSNYYSIGYRSPHPDDGKPHHIEVKLTNGKRGELNFRRTYAASPVNVRLDRAMQSDIAAGLLPNDIPVELAIEKLKAEKRTVTVHMRVRVPAAERVRVYLSVFNDVGKSAFTGNFPMVQHGGMMTWENDVVLSKRLKSQVVIAVHDELSDRVGFASRIVEFAE